MSLTSSTTQLTAAVNQLKQAKNAVLLAHYYQRPEIQEAADFLGDSLFLARQAAKTKADIIVFAGVHFMAETAKIINPSKKVLLPDLEAGCSLADACPAQEFKAFISQYPQAIVVSYINCSAAVKALSDLVCTSSNAERIINSLPKNRPIIFAPDQNLGRYLIKKTGRELILWQGSCIVHEAFSFERIVALFQKYPKAQFIAHPESRSAVLDIAHFIGSTTKLLQYVQKQPSQTFIVATEVGILHQMQKACPQKTFIPAPIEDESCACSECAYMKCNTLGKVYHCLQKESPEILLDTALIEQANAPLQKMLQIL
jgi:quinolinate synthase